MSEYNRFTPEEETQQLANMVQVEAGVNPKTGKIGPNETQAKDYDKALASVEAKESAAQKESIIKKVMSKLARAVNPMSEQAKDPIYKLDVLKEKAEIFGEIDTHARRTEKIEEPDQETKRAA